MNTTVDSGLTVRSLCTDIAANHSQYRQSASITDAACSWAVFLQDLGILCDGVIERCVWRYDTSTNVVLWNTTSTYVVWHVPGSKPAEFVCYASQVAISPDAELAFILLQTDYSVSNADYPNATLAVASDSQVRGWGVQTR